MWRTLCAGCVLLGLLFVVQVYTGVRVGWFDCDFSDVLGGVLLVLLFAFLLHPRPEVRAEWCPWGPLEWSADQPS